MTRASQEITACFMKMKWLFKSHAKTGRCWPSGWCAQLEDFFFFFSFFFNHVALKGEEVRHLQNKRSTVYFHWRAELAPTRGALERSGGGGEVVMVRSNRASNAAPPTPSSPILPACPGWPSSCLLSGDSVQPTIGSVEGAQRDQLQRMLPTQNPRRGNAVRFGVGWERCGELVERTHHTWLLLREWWKQREEARSCDRCDEQKHKCLRRREGNTKSGLGVSMS